MSTESKTETNAPAKTEEEIRAEIRKEIEAEYEKKAKDEAKAAAKEAKLAAAAAKTADPERRVKIKLFKDNGKYKDPLFVSVGNYRAAIPRGIEVDVPYYIAKHIEEMLAQDQQTSELISAYVEEYERNKSRLE